MIDFHCHLDLFPNPTLVADRCAVEELYVLSVTTTPSAWNGTRALERCRIRTALGLHPQIAHERKSELFLFDKFLPDTRYVGEIGLDGGPEFKMHWDDQISIFRHILSSCCAIGGRIMSIHSRRATPQVLKELSVYPSAGIPVLHWFSGSLRDLDRAVKSGCWFSVGPAMLFGRKGRTLVEKMPKNRVLTESDGPFAQVYGRAAMPWDTNLVVKGLADIWLVDETKVREILMDNFRVLTHY